jgi:hypothetical protein
VDRAQFRDVIWTAIHIPMFVKMLRFYDNQILCLERALLMNFALQTVK